jgi:hypothetical protein
MKRCAVNFVRRPPAHILRAMRRIALGIAGLLLCGGCVERQLSITSTPPGALVTYNDNEIGRTPLEKSFTYYGTFDAQVRLEGYETIKTGTPVIAPWWQWLGPDLIAELLPIRLVDRHEVQYTLKPLSKQQLDPDALIERSQRLREQLESSHLPATLPAPKHKPAPTTRRAPKAGPTTAPVN